MHQDYSEEDFDPDDQLRGKDVGVRSTTQDVCERISHNVYYMYIYNLKLTTMCICMCPILKLILGVTCGVSKESEEEEGGRGGGV